MNWRVGAGLFAVLMAGCAAAPQSPPGQAVDDAAAYACADGRTVRLQVTDAGLRVEGAGAATQLLLRDAGGVGPRQSVWSNERLRVDLGLGTAGEEVAIHLLGDSPSSLQCRRAAAAR